MSAPKLYVAGDALLAHLMGEAQPLPAELRALKLPASGLLDTRQECSGDMAFLRQLTGRVRLMVDPCAWVFANDEEVMAVFFFVDAPDQDGHVTLSGSLAPDYQSRGHGVRLYRRVVRHLSMTTDLTAINVQVFHSNGRSMHVHQVLGFVPVATGDDPELGAYSWLRLKLERGAGS